MHSRTESGLVGEDVYRAIRRDIIFGQLDAGARLRLERMKADYGASVSTIREALSRLATEGLVHATGQRGFSVAPMSETELREIADLRILVECHALGLSIDAGDTEWEGGSFQPTTSSVAWRTGWPQARHRSARCGSNMTGNSIRP